MLCYPGEVVPLASVFTARIVVFDIAVPITAGASVRLLLITFGCTEVDKPDDTDRIV